MVVTLVNLFISIYFLMILYLICKALYRKGKNKEKDKELGVDTGGYIYMDGKKQYNRTESTPYLALDTFIQNYSIDDTDRMVDVGSGKGRIPIYLNHKLGIPVTGIEINEESYQIAGNNLREYKDKHGKSHDDIRFVFDYAEKYPIKKEENLFFFFNPFHTEIFKLVVQEIIKNAKEHDKEVRIILYYPVNGFQRYLKKETDFELIDEFKSKGLISKREKFLIYRYRA